MAENKDAQNPEVNQDSSKAQENEQTAGERKSAVSDEVAALLKENMAMKKKLKSFESQQAEAEEKRLKEAGDFKALAEKAEQKAKALMEKAKLAELKAAAVAHGIIDKDLVALADHSKISVDDDGSIVGIDEVIQAFKEAKPNFFMQSQEPQQTVKPNNTPKPSGSNALGGTPTTFAEWEKMPANDRMAWAEKNTQAFKALCDAAKNVSPKF